MLEPHFGARAEEGDDLGRRETAEPGGCRKICATQPGIEKAGREHVACAGRIDKFALRLGRRHDRLAIGNDHRAAFAAGQDRELRVAAGAQHRIIERTGPIEREDLVLVGKQNVDTGTDEALEIRPVPVDTQGIGQTERHQAAGRSCKRRRLVARYPGLRAIEQVSFQVDDFGVPDGKDIGRADLEFGAASEIGQHRPGTVGRHQDKRARRLLVFTRVGRRFVGNPDPLDIVSEDAAVVVRRGPADEGRAAAERRRSGRHVRSRST